jgi:hypothetical protein
VTCSGCGRNSYSGATTASGRTLRRGQRTAADFVAPAEVGRGVEDQIVSSGVGRQPLKPQLIVGRPHQTVGIGIDQFGVVAPGAAPKSCRRAPISTHQVGQRIKAVQPLVIVFGAAPSERAGHDRQADLVDIGRP